MKIYVNQVEMKENAEKITYQNGFLLHTECRNYECREMGEKTTLMMLIHDEDKEVCNQPRPKKVRVWPHDSMAIALYLCTACGEITAEWDQG